MSTKSTSMEKAAIGTILIFIGNAIGMGLGFVARISIAKLTNPSDYGLIVLGITILNSLTVFSLLGLEKGLARNVAISEQASRLVSSAFQSVAVTSLLVVGLSTGIVLTNGTLVGESATVFVIFLIGVPFLTSHNLIKGIFQGKEDTVAKIISQDISRRGLVIIFSVAGILAGYEVVGAAIGWISGIVLTSVISFTLLRVRSPSLINTRKLFDFDYPSSKSLLTFSLPIMLSDSTWRLMQEVDNILIGYLISNTSSVGLYDVSYTLSKSLLIFLWTFQFLFLPMFTKMYQSSSRDELNKFYSSVTKWMCCLSLPTVALFLFYPQTLIEYIFGPDYSGGETSLMILGVGFGIFVVTGLSRHAITAIGKTRTIFVVSAASLLLDIILNMVFIPLYGINGAALATAIAFGLANLILTFVLFHKYRIHPYSHRLLLSSTISIILIFALNWSAESYITTKFSFLAVVVGSFLISALCFSTLGLTKYDRTAIKTIIDR
ncbi:flippase [Haloferax larsenii]|uniref:Flippase n=1 Tax=Haloferax larsenii TaxID=302484 RepID=A0ABY5RF06_HALLR|nr:flippase [Haloferax larsenii]UVE50739.1 flippase [Haloferax larsenii]